jgi:hypothetical protein
LSCKHLEVSGFGTYSVDVGGRAQVITLQKCSQCGKYLTLDGAEISVDKILGRGAGSKARMRTVTIQLSNDVYEKLESMIEREIGERKDPSKIMNEIVALGLKDYTHSAKRNLPS